MASIPSSRLYYFVEQGMDFKAVADLALERCGAKLII
jgi:hypothetical protein